MPALVSVIIGLALSEWEDACLEVVQASPAPEKNCSVGTSTLTSCFVDES